MIPVWKEAIDIVLDVEPDKFVVVFNVMHGLMKYSATWQKYPCPGQEQRNLADYIDVKGKNFKSDMV